MVSSRHGMVELSEGAVDMRYESNTEMLFTPVTLGALTLPNQT